MGPPRAVWLCACAMLAMPVRADTSIRGEGGAPSAWAARCREHFVKIGRGLGKLGPVEVTAKPAAPSGKYGESKRFGEVTLSIASPGGRLSATVGDDRSGHRYRGLRGIEEKRYGDWHSPFLDSVNGDPPRALGLLSEELHHRLAAGVLRGELVAEARDRPEAVTFAEVMKRTIGTCLADVTPDEADPSLQWTTRCKETLAAAHATLAAREPAFAVAVCERRPFNASCGRVGNADPRWNAMVTLGGGGAAPAGWTTDGENRASYGGDALLWAGKTFSPAQHQALSNAFRPALERCSRLMRAARRAP